MYTYDTRAIRQLLNEQQCNGHMGQNLQKAISIEIHFIRLTVAKKTLWKLAKALPKPLYHCSISLMCKLRKCHLLTMTTVDVNICFHEDYGQLWM